jgi:hypothetical protein
MTSLAERNQVMELVAEAMVERSRYRGETSLSNQF